MKRKFIIVFVVTVLGLTTACGSAGNNEIEIEKENTSEQITEEVTEDSKDIDTTTEATEEIEPTQQSEKEENNSAQNNAASSNADSLPEASANVDNQDYYSVCTDLPKSEVEAFAKEVRQSILEKDWKGLSEKAAYPITVAGVTYNNSSDFAAGNLDSLCDSDFMAAIEEESCTDMFCSYQGIMLGNGQVWISEVLNEDMTSQGLKVTAINSAE